MQRLHTRLGLILAFALGMGFSAAHAEVLSTPYNANNTSSGVVFQISSNSNNLLISDFGINLSNASTNYAIYIHSGALDSITNGGSIWTEIASGGPLTTAGTGNTTFLTGNGLGISIAAGSTDSFLIEVSGGSILNYTNGGSVGSVLAQNDALQILEGWGESGGIGGFGTTQSPRAANVSVVYSVPEPSTWAMLVIGFAGLGFFGYQRNRKSGIRMLGA